MKTRDDWAAEFWPVLLAMLTARRHPSVTNADFAEGTAKTLATMVIMGADEREKTLVELLTRAIPALSVAVDLAKSDASRAKRRALLRDVEAAVGPQKVGEAVSYGEPIYLDTSLVSRGAAKSLELDTDNRPGHPPSSRSTLRYRLNWAARRLAKVDGYLVGDDYDFAAIDRGRGKHYFIRACAAYEAFYGDSPDPAEIYPDGDEPDGGAS